MVPALFGVPDPTLGAVLAIAWLFVLAGTVYRYVRGNQSREQFYLVLSTGACWLAYSLLQVSGGVTGTAEVGLVALAVGILLGGFGAGALWWRSRPA
ncbi:hypothetical protein B4589_015345 (plasmid) [Halolamina sp. CBA1230]|uniref:hypothetical protein n=1 Tax=Halolamina sp. CBA1230 TaxID=1853690 RepID=UPI0009A23048|nr:hypothetical protein [Halolamina sp. CBA1230]QKY21798.1 hypothetical protein B4589_015345 [Halolamina sp. CBA1230]